MRTTIRMDDDLLDEVKQLAASTGKTITAVIEDSLRETLGRRRKAGSRSRTRLTTFRGRGVQPGVDLDSAASLYERMENARGADRH